MNDTNKFSTEKVLPIFVIILSVLNIFKNLDNIVSLTVLVSIIGITGAFLFFQKKPISTKLIYLWIISQIIIIEPFFDLSQGSFSFTFGFTLGLKSGDITLNINILAILLLGFVKILETANLVGKKITIKEFRDSELNNVFPVEGVITKRFLLENEKNWILVNLDQSFIYDNQKINQVLIKRKDDKSIKLKDKNQISFLRLVLNENDLTITSDKSKYPFVDWVVCE